MILQPAYRSYHLELGEVSSYPPGYKENAGIFCHNNPWVSIAETVIDDKNRAFMGYTVLCRYDAPDGKNFESYHVDINSIGL